MNQSLRRNLGFLAVGILFVFAAGCDRASSRSPVEVAEAYLRAGAAENNADILESLNPACASNEGMVKVNAVRVLGVAMEIDELTVNVESESDTAVMVRYTVSGSAHGEGGTTMILGATVETGEVNVENAEQSGSLSLVRVDNRWVVGC